MSAFGMNRSGKDASGWSNELMRWQQDQMKRGLDQSTQQYERGDRSMQRYEGDLLNQYGQGTSFLDDPYKNWTNTQTNLISNWQNAGDTMMGRVGQLDPHSVAAGAQVSRSFVPAYSNLASRLRTMNPSDPQYQMAVGRLDSQRARAMDDNVANRTADWVNTANRTQAGIFGTGAGLQQSLAEGGVNQALQRYGVRNRQLDQMKDLAQTGYANAQNMNQQAEGWGDRSGAQAQQNYQREAANANWGGKLLSGLAMTGLNAWAGGGFKGFINPFKKPVNQEFGV
jgi:hypothetical protein